MVVVAFHSGFNFGDFNEWNSDVMKRQVRCFDCGREVTLEFPDEFEGHSLSTYESIRSYVKFREWIKDDYSLGRFCWSKGKEVWICPECEIGTVWLAKGGKP